MDELNEADSVCLEGMEECEAKTGTEGGLKEEEEMKEDDEDVAEKYVDDGAAEHGLVVSDEELENEDEDDDSENGGLHGRTEVPARTRLLAGKERPIAEARTREEEDG